MGIAWRSCVCVVISWGSGSRGDHVGISELRGDRVGTVCVGISWGSSGELGIAWGSRGDRVGISGMCGDSVVITRSAGLRGDLLGPRGFSQGGCKFAEEILAS